MAINFPTSLDTFTTRNSGDTISEDHMNNVQDGVEALEVEVGTDTPATTSLRYKCDNFFVSATHVFFAQATPPTGWTTDAAHKDNVLACKSDSGTYSVVGANKGSWTYTGFTKDAHVHAGPSHIHTMGTHSHTTPDHTLTKAEIPTHLHTIQRDKNRSSTQGGTIMWSDQVGSGYDNTTDGSGDGLGGGAHNHGNTETVDPGDTNASGTGNTGAQSDAGITHNGADRPYATVGVVATYTA